MILNSKIILIVVSFLFLITFSFSNNTYASCNLDGSVSVSLGSGGTAHGSILGESISVNYPNVGTLRGTVNASMGSFTLWNPYTEQTLRGTIDISSCSNNSNTTIPTITMCPAPSTIGCIKESSYQDLKTSGDRYGLSSSDFWVKKLVQCRQEIDAYNLATEKWYQCQKDYYGYDKSTNTYGQTKAEKEYSAYIATTPIQKIDYNARCKSILGPNAIASSYKPETYCDCVSGYKLEGKSCVVGVFDQNLSCTHPYGPNSIIDPKNSKNCICATGYEWDKSGATCVFKQIKTNDEICQDSFGLNSYSTGLNNNTGKLECVCKNGFTWEDVNASKTSCIAKKVEITATTPIELKETKKEKITVPISDLDIVYATQNTEDVSTISKSNLEQAKKVKWYQKIFNWFKK